VSKEYTKVRDFSELRGMNILILGAMSDIARAIAHRYARQGHSITLAARDPGRLAADAADLHVRYGVPVQCLPFDAEQDDAHAGFYAALSPRPDVAVCAFGQLSDQVAAQQDWPQARTMLMVNYVGAVSILERVAHGMEQRGSGTIIGISSVAGDRGRAGNYFYGSAKAGFTAYLSGLRNRLAGKGVHVMTVKPGFVDTAMTAGMNTPPLLTASPEAVADDVYRAAQKRKNVLYTRWFWRWIMLVIRHIPESLFKRLSL